MINILHILRALGACDKARAFAGKTPDEALAIATPSDLSWLCSVVLTLDERASLAEATAPAGRAFEEAIATARRAYREAIASALRAYEEATAPARRAALRSSKWWKETVG